MTSTAPDKPAEYTTEVPYLRTFSNDLSPAMLRFVAALNGFAPPPAEGFDYCELGCGTGDTTATLAAANPGSRFLGVDISPEHVAFANGLAARGGLANLRFVERDFEALMADDLPPFDFICAHGVLSWVSPAKRAAVIRLAAAKLKPGGLLHVSYNALPGWSAIEPLRKLIQDGAAAGGGDALERAHRGVSLAKLLCDAGAAYFESNPTARSMLDTMMSTGLPYVVHEYLQPHWHPMYFADVAGEMADFGLYYIGGLPLYLNYRDLAVGPVLVALLKGVTDRLVFEGLKDYALNEFFRRDVYVKGAVGRSDAAGRSYLEQTPFGTFRAADKVAREARLPQSALTFTSPLFEAVIAALAERSQPLAELARRPELSAFGAAQVREAVLHLALGDQIVPMRYCTTAAPAGAGMFRFGLPYNKMILEQRLSAKTPVVLAAPAAGMGVVVSMLDAVCLRIVTGVAKADRPAHIRAFVERQPLKLHVADRPIESAEEQAKVLSAEVADFCARRAPKLVELGILEEAD